MSAIRMLVLGVVQAAGQAHGYQVRRELLSWRADAWASVAPGSIYQALRTLTKRGLLEQVATESGGGGPERTVYRITPDGETEFFHLLRSAISDPESGTEALNAAFAFLTLLHRSEMADLLGYRVRALWSRLVTVEPPSGGSMKVDVAWQRAVAGAEGPLPPQLEALGRLRAAQIRAEIDWSVELGTRIREGAYAFVEDAPAPTNQA